MRIADKRLKTQTCNLLITMAKRYYVLLKIGENHILTSTFQ